ncbi:MAG: fructose-bisphosphatase class III [SAR324 cluster bacterium]|nr:fructose-bisphosphatase class III [SAR324 cluster bacterium]
MNRSNSGNLPKQSAMSNPIEVIGKEILDLEAELNSYIPSTLWISDLHGEGDRFKSILRGRFGLLYQTIKEALPKLPEDEVRYLSRVIRKRSIIEDAKIDLTLEQTLTSLVAVLRYKVSNVRYDVDEIILPEFREYILRLISGLSVPPSLMAEEAIAMRLVYHLSFSIKHVLIDRLVVLGDIFDRGSQPDKIIRILASPQYKKIVTLVFGNHDVLWMGAAAGCRPLVVEAMRVSCRYDHFKMLKNLGFDVTKLKKFAVKTYPDDKNTGKIKAKTKKGRAMEKALAVIQFKLEDKLLRDRPEFEMSSRLILSDLAERLKSGHTEGLNDTFFPTINLENPAEITSEEAEVIEDLVEQFKNNRKLKRLLAFFFKQGEVYHIHNNMLNIHALIPSTEDGDFESFLGKKGKTLLDYIQGVIVRSGKKYLEGKDVDPKDADLYFYLWCGPKSPFFGKEAMKTYERYFLVDKELHKEPSLYWKQNLRDSSFKFKVLAEFGAKRVIFGHTPVDVTKGKKMASDDGVAINIDGGFAAAYFNRGHALVHTPHQLYGIILPREKEVTAANQTNDTIPLSVELIEEFEKPLLVKDTFRGKRYQSRLTQLKEQLNTEYNN